MKYLLFFTVFFLFGCCKQSLVGSYTSTPEHSMAFAGKKITFNKDNTFNYSWWDDSFSIVQASDSSYVCREVTYAGDGTYKSGLYKIKLFFDNVKIENSVIFTIAKKDPFVINFDINTEEYDSTYTAYIYSSESKLLTRKSMSQNSFQVEIDPNNQPQILLIPILRTGNTQYNNRNVSFKRLNIEDGQYYNSPISDKYYQIDLNDLDDATYYLPVDQDFNDRNKYYQRDKEMSLKYNVRFKKLHYKFEGSKYWSDLRKIKE